MNEETKAAMESGRPVMVFNIGSVGQLNPNATEVHNVYYGDQFVPKEVREAAGDPDKAAANKSGQSDKAPAGKSGKPTRPSTLARVKKTDDKPRELMTFSKRGILKEHLKLLYQQLVADGWLAKETQIDAFLDLFSGERSESTIIWAGKYGKGTLVYLFQQMALDGVISVPQGFSIPNILMGHVTNPEGNLLTNLDKGDAPAQKSGAEIMEYMNILKQNANRMGRRPARPEEDEEGDLYGNDLNPYELGEEGLHYSSRIR
ncbi:MAG: hypothetical protein SOY43_07905 [Parabacteroides sp.]|nr:hypothetical protein [bacterium]MDY4102789.1 hypothetical protein [Parabacteroides sp.]